MSNTKSTAKHTYQPIIRVEPSRHRSTYQAPEENMFALWVMFWLALGGLALVVALILLRIA